MSSSEVFKPGERVTWLDSHQRQQVAAVVVRQTPSGVEVEMSGRVVVVAPEDLRRRPVPVRK